MMTTPARPSSPSLDPLDPDAGAPLPAFPLDGLPAAWATWVGESATLANAPPDHVALGLFAAVAGVAGAGIVAEPVHGWREPLVLWQCAVGAAGAGTPAALAAGRR